MATSCQQPRVFDDAEAQTLAGLWAGWETVNTNEAEAMNKARVLRRKASEKNLRVIDLLELPEMRKAIDDQLSPVRFPCASCAAMELELTDTAARLIEREKQTRKLIDDYEAKLKEKARAARQHTKHHRPIKEFLGFAWGYPEWRMAALLTLILMLPWLMRTSFFFGHSWASYALIALGLLLVLSWAAAEIDETGWGPLLMKLAILFGGLKTLNSSGADHSSFILAGVALLTATPLLNNICDRARQVPFIAAVMEFFQ